MRTSNATPPYLVYVTPPVPAEAAARHAWFDRVQQCGEAGVGVVQIRDKVLSSEALAPHVAHCRQLLDAAPPHRPKPLLLLNGHPDMHEGLDGAHFPESLLDRVPEVLQQPPGPGFMTGVSVHSVEAALKAARLGVDYLQVGTMFVTDSHPEKLEVEGPALVAAIDAALQQAQLRDHVRLCGIGGVTPDNCGQVLRAGADGVAVISGIAAVEGDVRRTVAAFGQAFAAAVEQKEKGGGRRLT